MYDMNDEWDRYMVRYGGYSGATLAGFEERGIATYDKTTDTYTVQNGEFDPVTGEFRPDGTTFTLGLSPEFAWPVDRGGAENALNALSTARAVRPTRGYEGETQ